MMKEINYLKELKNEISNSNYGGVLAQNNPEATKLKDAIVSIDWDNIFTKEALINYKTSLLFEIFSYNGETLSKKQKSIIKNIYKPFFENMDYSEMVEIAKTINVSGFYTGLNELDAFSNYFELYESDKTVNKKILSWLTANKDILNGYKEEYCEDNEELTISNFNISDFIYYIFYEDVQIFENFLLDFFKIKQN